MAYVPPGRCSGLAAGCICGTKRQGWDDDLQLHLSGLCTHLVLALTLHHLGGSGSSIPSPAGGAGLPVCPSSDFRAVAQVCLPTGHRMQLFERNVSRALPQPKPLGVSTPLTRPLAVRVSSALSV